MKYSLRFVSAVLAAILCGAAFSACANEVKPPVTDVTADTPITDAPATIAPITTVTTDAYTTDAPVTTEAPTTDAPITETTYISTVTNVITTEDVETTDTSTTNTSTTAAPATDAPSVTTEAPVTVDPVTTEVSVTTEVPASTQVVVTTDALVTTEVPETTTPETEDLIDTYGKPLSDVLYVTPKGSVMIKGSDTFFLPEGGSYNADNDFVVRISPKLTDLSLYIKFDKSSYTQEIPSVFIDSAGNPVTEKYYQRTIYTEAGIVVVYVISKEAANYTDYIFTVFPDGTYNAYTACAEVRAVAYCDEKTGLAVIENADNGDVFDLYCTYDGGKTFTFHSTVSNLGGEFSGVQVAASRYGYFFLAITGGRYYRGVYSNQLVLKVNNGQISEPANVSDIRVFASSTRTSRLHIDGNLGVWSIIQSEYDGRINNDGEHCVHYFVTTDGGASWQRYDPALITEENGNAQISSFE